MSDWRAAIVQAPADQHLISEILRSDSVLAYDWLVRRVTEESIQGDADMEPPVADALNALEREQKLSLLRSVRPGSGYRWLVAAIIGGD